MRGEGGINEMWKKPVHMRGPTSINCSYSDPISCNSYLQKRRFRMLLTFFSKFLLGGKLRQHLPVYSPPLFFNRRFVNYSYSPF